MIGPGRPGVSPGRARGDRLRVSVHGERYLPARHIHHTLTRGGPTNRVRPNLLRAGSTAALLGHRVMAPSTLGTFLRAFTFGDVRQIDHVLGVALSRAWAVAVGPGELPLVLDLDSFFGEVYGYAKQGAGYLGT